MTYLPEYRIPEWPKERTIKLSGYRIREEYSGLQVIEGKPQHYSTFRLGELTAAVYTPDGQPHERNVLAVVEALVLEAQRRGIKA